MDGGQWWLPTMIRRDQYADCTTMNGMLSVLRTELFNL
jgi:hypothetical protein